MPRRPDEVVLTNRKARHDYSILEVWECGIVLHGAEVKSLRDHHANLQDAYARVDDGEIWLNGMHILPYASSRGEIDPVRRRKLLLHASEIDTITRQAGEKGLTLVPLKVYFKEGRAKVELALAKGKKNYDKRHALAERDANRDVARALRERQK